MKVLFWIRKAKINKAGKAPLYCRITVEGHRANEFSTGIRVLPALWDAKRQRVRNDSLANMKLSEIRQRLEAIYLDLEKRGTNYSASTIKEVFEGNKSFNMPLLELVADYLAYLESLKGTAEAVSPNTIRRWRVCQTNVTLFLEDLRKKTLACSDFGLVMAEQYKMFLMKELKCKSLEYVNRHIEAIKQILAYGVAFGKVEDNPLAGLKLKKGYTKELVYLTQEELRHLEGVRLKIEKFQRVLDLFIFQCYTGLSYMDLMDFDVRDLRVGSDGRLWIMGKRGKNELPYSLPLLKKAREILEKYDDKLPSISNQRYNDYLKGVADFLGVKKRLTTHVARKTFGVMALNYWGVSLETVSKMMGHRSIKTTEKYYVKVTESKIAKDMKDIE